MSLLLVVFVVFGDHGQVVLGQRLVDQPAGLTVSLLDGVQRAGDLRARTVRAVCALSLYMGRTRLAMGQVLGVDTHHPGDLVHQRSKFVELLRGDRLVLGAGIGHDLVLVHLLVRREHELGLDALADQHRRQGSQVEQLWWSSLLLRRPIVRHGGGIILLGHLIFAVEPRLIGMGVDHTVLVPEPVLEERLLHIVLVGLELVADQLDHRRLQPPLTQHGVLTGLAGHVGGHARPLHRQQIELGAVPRLLVLVEVGQ